MFANQDLPSMKTAEVFLDRSFKVHQRVYGQNAKATKMQTKTPEVLRLIAAATANKTDVCIQAISS
jgi:hypothetical protein